MLAGWGTEKRSVLCSCTVLGVDRGDSDNSTVGSHLSEPPK